MPFPRRFIERGWLSCRADPSGMKARKVLWAAASVTREGCQIFRSTQFSAVEVARVRLLECGSYAIVQRLTHTANSEFACLSDRYSDCRLGLKKNPAVSKVHCQDLYSDKEQQKHDTEKGRCAMRRWSGICGFSREPN